MSSRANYVIIRDGDAQAFYSSQGGLGTVYPFALGPEEAAGLAVREDPVTQLMEPAFAEGCYLIDFDARLAIIYGMPNLSDDIAEDILSWPEGEGPTEEERRHALVIPEVNRVFDESALDGRDSVTAYLHHISELWTGWTVRWDPTGTDGIADYLRSKGVSHILPPPPGPGRMRSRGQKSGVVEIQP